MEHVCASALGGAKALYLALQVDTPLRESGGHEQCKHMGACPAPCPPVIVDSEAHYVTAKSPAMDSTAWQIVWITTHDGCSSYSLVHILMYPMSIYVVGAWWPN